MYQEQVCKDDRSKGATVITNKRVDERGLTGDALIKINDPGNKSLANGEKTR